uniref:Uncharacterized protein n=1 Tax=Cyanothece sp. (strain PCC 7425 / ATCC 29141) TaxID=395961 RepID=B8HYM7_CYAP4
MDRAMEVKQIATQLLAGLMANPHIYPAVSDEGGQGGREQELIAISIQMAESLIAKAEATQ